jgi:arylsulfatase A-like enzyme
VKDYALNTLFSPPQSEFRFKIKVPESGFLEFGVGFLKEFSGGDEENPEIVEFSIFIQDKKENIPVFFKKISPISGESLPEIDSHRIDLSSFAEKTVYLHFLTTSSANPEPSQVYCYWYNPVIVTNQNKINERKENSPNIILISLDTLRADHLHCYGYERKTSPFIDKLAENSVLFANCYSPTGKTLPSHMSMFTSLYPIHHHLLANGNYVIQKLDESIPTMTEVLRKHNYFTGAFTGGAYVDAQYGFSKGFDFYYNDPSTYHRASVGHLYRQTKHWLEANRNKKFFLFLHTYQIHEPYFSPEPYNLMYLNKNTTWKSANLVEIFEPDPYKVLTDDERKNLVALYDGEITYTDEHLIKPLVDLLKESGLYDRTLIVLTSDHGEEFYEHKGWRHGYSLYNEQLKVPLIMKFPGSEYGGKRITGNVSLVDLMPTILEYAGIEFSGYEPDGISLLEEVKGKKTEKRIILGSRYVYMLKERQSFTPFLINFCAIEDSTKLILNSPHPGKHPLFFSPSPPPFPVDETEMFDLDIDPEELTNSAHDYRFKIQDILSRILNHYRYALELEKEYWEGTAIDSRLLKQLKALGYIK